MERHGLQTKIKDIESLNIYFESQLGKSPQSISNRITDGSVHGKNDAKNSFTQANTSNQDIGLNTSRERAILFPYQRRARSFSPPKKEASAKTFPGLNQSGGGGEEEEEKKVKPVLAKSFIFGKPLLEATRQNMQCYPLILPVVNNQDKKKPLNISLRRQNISSKNKNYPTIETATKQGIVRSIKPNLV